MAEHYNIPKLKKRRQSLRSSLSKAEIILWKRLSGKQMLGCKFRRQYSVDQYILDFYCPKLKLAVEVGGDPHFFLGAAVHDKERQEHIEKYGIRFPSFTDTDVCENIDDVCEAIYSKLEPMIK